MLPIRDRSMDKSTESILKFSIPWRIHEYVLVDLYANMGILLGSMAPPWPDGPCPNSSLKSRNSMVSGGVKNIFFNIRRKGLPEFQDLKNESFWLLVLLWIWIIFTPVITPGLRFRHGRWHTCRTSTLENFAFPELITKPSLDSLDLYKTTKISKTTKLYRRKPFVLWGLLNVLILDNLNDLQLANGQQTR